MKNAIFTADSSLYNKYSTLNKRIWIKKYSLRIFTNNGYKRKSIFMKLNKLKVLFVKQSLAKIAYNLSHLGTVGYIYII